MRRRVGSIFGGRSLRSSFRRQCGWAEGASLSRALCRRGFDGGCMRVGLALLIGMVVGGGVAAAQTVGDASLQPRTTAPATDCTVAAGEWGTPAEKSCYRTTPDYEETMAYLRRMQGAAPGQVKIEA